MKKDELNKALINESSQILRNGGVVIIPTETVYGIAADATNKSAIERIYSIKNRDDAKPLQIMCSSIEMAQEYAEFNQFASGFCKLHWPGALTAVMDKVEGCSVASNFNKIDDSIGIRVPDHKFVLELINNLGTPLAVSSANISGQSDSGDVRNIPENIRESVDMVIDMGSAKIGMASTVVDFRCEPPKVLRQGAVILPV